MRSSLAARNCCPIGGICHGAGGRANLYLAGLGAELLAEDAPRLVGLSEETTCYVSREYFAEDDPFADFIVHEAAHIFHNCKRATVGLPETKTKEWLLDIEFRKRETFAYSCEAYARVLELSKKPSARRALAADYGSAVRINEERVDPAEVARIVAEAAAARNGWKVILERCATRRPRSALALLRESTAREAAARSSSRDVRSDQAGGESQDPEPANPASGPRTNDKPRDPVLV